MINLDGFHYYPDYFDRQAQEMLLETVRNIAAQTPLYTPFMPKTGKPMSVRQTNCGQLGWVTDKEYGYRYQPTHPVTGKNWPPIPEMLLKLWQELSAFSALPDACLINFYEPDAKMGLHQDKDEEELAAPVISISLGDSCLFRMGGLKRTHKTQSIRLNSGDVIIFGGTTRLAYHGVDRIYSGTSSLLKTPGRINLTLRRVLNIDE